MFLYPENFNISQYVILTIFFLLFLIFTINLIFPIFTKLINNLDEFSKWLFIIGMIPFIIISFIRSIIMFKVMYYYLMIITMILFSIMGIILQFFTGADLSLKYSSNIIIYFGILITLVLNTILLTIRFFLEFPLHLSILSITIGVAMMFYGLILSFKDDSGFFNIFDSENGLSEVSSFLYAILIIFCAPVLFPVLNFVISIILLLGFLSFYF